MSNLAIFFGPENGAVHRVAKSLASKMESQNPELIHVNDASADDLARFDTIIFGISTIGRDTWDQKFGNVDWAKFMPTVSAFDFTGKKVAIFGLGDHITYAYHFVNSMGILARVVIKNGGQLVGKVSPEGYDFQDSEALEGGMFLGLPIDEDFEDDKTDSRLDGWVAQLNKEL
ncbi:MAG: flavodoxin domain-containing protein [Mariniphaga sp.]